MTRPTTAPQKYGDLLLHPRLSYREVAKALNSGGKLTSIQISEMTGVSMTSVKNTLAYLKQLRFIHVCGWHRPKDKHNSVYAIYKKGKGIDVQKPAPRYLEGYKAKKAEKKEEARRKTQQGVQAWKTLTECLAPKRTAQEQYEINRLYLNWISEGAYG